MRFLKAISLTAKIALHLPEIIGHALMHWDDLPWWIRLPVGCLGACAIVFLCGSILIVGLLKIFW